MPCVQCWRVQSRRFAQWWKSYHFQEGRRQMGERIRAYWTFWQGDRYRLGATVQQNCLMLLRSQCFCLAAQRKRERGHTAWSINLIVLESYLTLLMAQWPQVGWSCTGMRSVRDFSAFISTHWAIERVTVAPSLIYYNSSWGPFRASLRASLWSISNSRSKLVWCLDFDKTKRKLLTILKVLMHVEELSLMVKYS